VNKKVKWLLSGMAASLVMAALILSGLWAVGMIPLRDTAAPPSGPCLEVDGCERTFMGRGKPGEILSSSLILKNVGSEPLDFWIHKSSPAAVIEPQEGTIQPRGMIELKVTVRLCHEGQDERVVIMLHTNDPRRPTYLHAFEASCPPPIKVYPEIVSFGTVVAESSPTFPLRLSDPEGMPLELGRVQVTSSIPFLTFEIKPASKGKALLLVGLDPHTPKGDYRGELRIGVSGRHREIVIPVSAYVRGIVRTAPETLFLLRQAGHQEKESTLYVWRADGKPLGIVEAVSKPPWLSIAEHTISDEHRRLFTVRINSSSVPCNRGTIGLRFSSVSEEVTVDVFVDQ